jgi:hypothetical protein
MGDGGRPLAQLRALSERFPRLGPWRRPVHRRRSARSTATTSRRCATCRLAEPASFSEHLAWSTHDTGFLNDLLPLPYTEATLARVASHIDQVQDTLGRRMLLENPSTYLVFAESEMDEVTFLTEIARAPAAGSCSTSTTSSSPPPTRTGTPRLYRRLPARCGGRDPSRRP